MLLGGGPATERTFLAAGGGSARDRKGDKIPWRAAAGRECRLAASGANGIARVIRLDYAAAMDVGMVPVANVHYLEHAGFGFDRGRLAWVKKSLGREWVISFEEASAHDVAWLKSRVVDFATQPMSPPISTD